MANDVVHSDILIGKNGLLEQARLVRISASNLDVSTHINNLYFALHIRYGLKVLQFSGLFPRFVTVS